VGNAHCLLDENNNTRLLFEGAMDEHSDYSQIAVDFSKEVVCDFDRIKHINSAGIKAWVQWHSLVQDQLPNLKFSFINCPKPIVDQINMVTGFVPDNSLIRSFKVPYFCEECELDKTYTFVLGREYVQLDGGQFKLEIPEKPCNCESNGEMEPDVVEQKYFRFLKK